MNWEELAQQNDDDTVETAPDTADGFSPRRLALFIWQHKYYLLLAPIVGLLGTVIHEGGHALMAIILGGEVTEFHILPDSDFSRLGWTAYELPAGAPGHWVTLGPTLAWTVIAACHGPLVARTPRVHARKLAYIMLFVLPLGDLSLSMSSLMWGHFGSDYFRLFSGYELEVAGLALVFVSVFAAYGWKSCRLATDDALSRSEYLLGLAVLLAIPWIPL